MKGGDVNDVWLRDGPVGHGNDADSHGNYRVHRILGSLCRSEKWNEGKKTESIITTARSEKTIEENRQ